MTSAALKDRVAIVFGSATGIGAACARTLAVQLTRSVATQYGRQGIRCNAILPGFVKVERQHTDDTASAEFRQSLARNHLTPYIGEPQDIANVVAFLAGDDSRFVTGHLFSVDGGLSAHQMYADLVGDVA